MLENWPHESSAASSLLRQVLLLNSEAMKLLENGDAGRSHKLLLEALQIVQEHQGKLKSGTKAVSSAALSSTSAPRYDTPPIGEMQKKCEEMWALAMSVTVSNLGCQLRKVNQPVEALSFLNTAKEVETALYGKPSTSTMLNISAVLLALGELQSALEIARYCVLADTEGEKVLRVTALHNYAMILGQLPLPTNEEKRPSLVLADFDRFVVSNENDANTRTALKEDCEGAMIIMRQALSESEAYLSREDPTRKLLHHRCLHPEEWIYTMKLLSPAVVASPRFANENAKENTKNVNAFATNTPATVPTTLIQQGIVTEGNNSQKNEKMVSTAEKDTKIQEKSAEHEREMEQTEKLYDERSLQVLDIHAPQKETAGAITPYVGAAREEEPNLSTNVDKSTKKVKKPMHRSTSPADAERKISSTFTPPLPLQQQGSGEKGLMMHKGDADAARKSGGRKKLSFRSPHSQQVSRSTSEKQSKSSTVHSVSATTPSISTDHRKSEGKSGTEGMSATWRRKNKTKDKFRVSSQDVKLSITEDLQLQARRALELLGAAPESIPVDPHLSRRPFPLLCRLPPCPSPIEEIHQKTVPTSSMSPPPASLGEVRRPSLPSALPPLPLKALEVDKPTTQNSVLSSEKHILHPPPPLPGCPSAGDTDLSAALALPDSEFSPILQDFSSTNYPKPSFSADPCSHSLKRSSDRPCVSNERDISSTLSQRSSAVEINLSQPSSIRKSLTGASPSSSLIVVRSEVVTDVVPTVLEDIPHSPSAPLTEDIPKELNTIPKANVNKGAPSEGVASMEVFPHEEESAPRLDATHIIHEDEKKHPIESRKEDAHGRKSSVSNGAECVGATGISTVENALEIGMVPVDVDHKKQIRTSEGGEEIAFPFDGSAPSSNEENTFRNFTRATVKNGQWREESETQDSQHGDVVRASRHTSDLQGSPNFRKLSHTDAHLPAIPFSNAVVQKSGNAGVGKEGENLPDALRSGKNNRTENKEQEKSTHTKNSFLRFAALEEGNAVSSIGVQPFSALTYKDLRSHIRQHAKTLDGCPSSTDGESFSRQISPFSTAPVKKAKRRQSVLAQAAEFASLNRTPFQKFHFPAARQQWLVKQKREEELFRLKREKNAVEKREHEIFEMKLTAIINRTKNRAACRIQDVWQFWWYSFGKPRREAQQKRAEERERTVHHRHVQELTRKQAVQQRKWTITDFPPPIVAIHCAQKWLDKTKAVRYLTRKHISLWGRREVEIQRLCARIQARVRGMQARARYSRTITERQQLFWTLRPQEMQDYAALLIQKMYRCHRARQMFFQAYRQRYEPPAIKIQEWFRLLLFDHRSRQVDTTTVNRRITAAVVIQTAWRGYLGRLRSYMQKLRRAMDNCRQEERTSVHVVQKCGRGYLQRKALGVAALNSCIRRIQRKQEKEIQDKKDAERVEAKERFPEIVVPKNAYESSCLERADSVYRQQQKDREEYDIPLFYEPEAQRLQEDWIDAIRTVPLMVRRQRADEDLRCTLELQAFRRQRSATKIQRAFRAWRNAKDCSHRSNDYLLICKGIYHQREYERIIQQKEYTRQQMKGVALYGDVAAPQRESVEAVREELKKEQDESLIYISPLHIRTRPQRLEAELQIQHAEKVAQTNLLLQEKQKQRLKVKEQFTFLNPSEENVHKAVAKSSACDKADNKYLDLD